MDFNQVSTPNDLIPKGTTFDDEFFQEGKLELSGVKCPWKLKISESESFLTFGCENGNGYRSKKFNFSKQIKDGVSISYLPYSFQQPIVIRCIWASYAEATLERENAFDKLQFNMDESKSTQTTPQ